MIKNINKTFITKNCAKIGGAKSLYLMFKKLRISKNNNNNNFMI